METLGEFRAKVLRCGESREHKVTGSVGVYDAYKWIRKNKWFDIGRPLTEKEFYTIVRSIGNLLSENLCQGHDIKFPTKMGILTLRKYRPSLEFKDGKLKTSLPIDWDATLKLWHEDEEAYSKKLLVRSTDREIFKILYDRSKADYNNKSFYEFQVNRDIKRLLVKRARQGRIDAFLS